ncbi:hypothetical protein BDW69DRAFT_173370 [Aspergillus filifer]
MDLQPPSVLAQLPRPLHASTGKTHISEVYSLANAKKRKRYEVAVAVDGESVNLYNIQNPKLVTSYAVPPQSSFSCPPCSLRRKLPNGSGVKRQTYVGVKKEIKAFTEESSASAPVISSATFAVNDSTSPIVFVGILPGPDTEDEDKDPFDVLAVHRDGRVRRLSPDLGSQRWSLQHSEILKSPGHEIRGCFLLEFDDAKRSLFKRRPDLASLALGDSSISGSSDPSIVLLVTYPEKDQISFSEVRIQVFSIPGEVSGRSGDESQQMRHLLTAALPDVGEGEVNTGHLNWQFHSSSAGLNLSFGKGFINFDLSHYTPAVTSKFILKDEEFSSVMRVTAQSVIGAGKSMIALYDTQYKSIQRSIVTNDLPSASSQARTTFINYFAKLDLVVATRGNSLLAFDLASSQSLSTVPGKRSRDGLLIDAIGRGIGAASQWEGVSKKHRFNDNGALILTSSEEAERWNQSSLALREAASTRHAAEFDRVVLAHFGAGENKNLPSPGQYVDPEMISYLLSFIFSVEGDLTTADKLSASSSIKVTVAFWPARTCEWLARLGYLYPENVEASLRRAYKPRIFPTLPVGTFSKAIQECDPSLRRFVVVLQGPAAFDANELAHALKLFLDEARLTPISTDNEEPQKALTNGVDTSFADQPTRGVPPPTIQTIFTGLNTILLKLHAHPHPTMTSSLRATLTRTDLISTIHHLRLSLATGGHTTRFTETPPTPISPHLISPTLPLPTIADLLNAAVDAIGPSGWVSINPGDYSTLSDPEAAGLRDVALIAEMKTEIGAALAGVEEATFLSGILREYLRYAKSVDSSAHTHLTTTDDNLPATSTSVRHEKLNGADLLVFGAHDEDGEGAADGDASGKLLPLSLKATKDVSRTKVLKGTGKVVQRSKREMGYLRRKAVGKYTFERLVV